MQNVISLQRFPRIIPQWRLMPVALYRLSLAAVDIYLCSLLVYFAARALLGHNFWYVTFIDNIIQWLLALAFVLIPPLVWRNRKRAASCLLPVFMFVHLYGTLFLPGRSHAAPDNAITLRVMTYNTASHFMEPDDLIALIRESDADIIGLQELGADEAAAIDDQLQYEYPYRILHGIGVHGKGLLSRYPITDYEFFQSSQNRPYIEAHLTVNGTPLTVFVAHPHPSQLQHHFVFTEHPAARDELDMILARISPDAPTLVIGDFNLTDQSRNYRLLRDFGLTDTFHESGWGFGATFPAVFLPYPVVRIDYIWTTHHFMPLKSYVGPDAGSDHLPLISEIALIQG